jgi:hypothetical protein
LAVVCVLVMDASMKRGFLISLECQRSFAG